jgi:hypothetical protein
MVDGNSTGIITSVAHQKTKGSGVRPSPPRLPPAEGIGSPVSKPSSSYLQPAFSAKAVHPGPLRRAPGDTGNRCQRQLNITVTFSFVRSGAVQKKNLTSRALAPASSAPRSVTADGSARVSRAVLDGWMRLHSNLMPEPDGIDLKIRCPACGSSDVRRSHHPTSADRFLGMFWRFNALRCRSCHHRFRVRLSANDTSGDAGRRAE